MEDYRLYGMDAGEQRFGSRSKRRALLLDRLPKPRRPLGERLLILSAVVVGVSFVLAVLFVALVLTVVYFEGGYGTYYEPVLSPPERTARVETQVARFPLVATNFAETQIAEGRPVVLDGPSRSAKDYFDGNIDACISGAGVSDPCEVDRQVEFTRGAALSRFLPNQPPSLEAMLFNSWDGDSLSEVPEYALLSSTHVVARGRFIDDSLSCKGYPSINPEWSVNHAGLGVPEPSEGQRVVVDFGTYHWMCFAEFTVHEYLVGAGGVRLNVNLAAAAVAYESGIDFETKHGQSTLDRYRASVTDHFFGSDWVVWLGPSYSMAVEAWTAYSLWDVQKGDDGIVRVVSPAAAHYEEMGLTESALDRLRLPLTDFRRDIRAAHASRVERTSGRIGVGTETPKLVKDVFKLEDYYEEVGAYQYPIATPAPPPTSPYPPTDLYGELRTDPQPEVDLEWRAPASSQVTTYKIMRVDNLGNEVVVAEIPSEFVEVTDRHLPIAGAEYTYTVIAVNEHGESAPSAPFVLRVP